MLIATPHSVTRTTLRLTTSLVQFEVSTTYESVPRRYFELALSAKSFEQLADGSWFAVIPGFQGVYGYGDAKLTASLDLAGTLEDWVFLKIADRDDDLPILDGIDLNNK